VPLLPLVSVRAPALEQLRSKQQPKLLKDFG